MAHTAESLADLAGRYPAIREILAAARQTMIETFPGIVEEAHPKAGIIGYGYGPGYKGVVATLILGRNSLKIGLPYGSELADPSHLLEGSGKVHRHIPITTVAALRQPAVRRLLLARLEAWRQRSGLA